MSAKGAESGLESTIDCQYTYTFITRISFTHGPPRRSAIPLRRLKTKKENAEKERARKRKAVQVIDRTSDLSSAQESKDEARAGAPGADGAEGESNGYRQSPDPQNVFLCRI